MSLTFNAKPLRPVSMTNTSSIKVLSKDHHVPRAKSACSQRLLFVLLSSQELKKYFVKKLFDDPSLFKIKAFKCVKKSQLCVADTSLMRVQQFVAISLLLMSFHRSVALVRSQTGVLKGQRNTRSVNFLSFHVSFFIFPSTPYLMYIYIYLSTAQKSQTSMT